jgi:hypothetical protein
MGERVFSTHSNDLTKRKGRFGIRHIVKNTVTYLVTDLGDVPFLTKYTRYTGKSTAGYHFIIVPTPSKRNEEEYRSLRIRDMESTIKNVGITSYRLNQTKTTKGHRL